MLKIGKDINTAFEEGYINVRVFHGCSVKFKIDEIPLESKPRGKPENVVNDNVQRNITETNSCRTGREIELRTRTSYFIIIRHSVQIGKIGEMEK